MRHTISSKVKNKGTKNRRRSHMLDAVTVYLAENGNSFKSTVSLALILSRDPRFVKVEKLTRENTYLWGNACEVITED